VLSGGGFGMQVGAVAAGIHGEAEGGSIYRSHRRWCPISQGCAGGRRETGILEQGMGGFHRGASSGDHRLRSYGGYR
jgi:hypothetical protein